MARLKLFRTAIGFHDAYVAAPSRKAALAAWGADADLFARGMAEQVEEDGPGKAALDDPGTVVKIVRGSADDHLAALPVDAPPKRKAAAKADAKGVAASKRAAKRASKPSRKALEAADDALEAAEAEARETMAELRREEAALAKRRREAEAAIMRERERLQAKRDAAFRAYRAAMDAWRGSED